MRLTRERRPWQGSADARSSGLAGPLAHPTHVAATCLSPFKIAKKLTIKTGKNAGQHPSVASVYRALADAEETDASAGLRADLDAPRKQRHTVSTG
ncbi:hypothetical protein ACQI4E_29665 [Streptomyces sp. CA-252508]|uniref:hypothetical protein n=1 Tax=Streptomyces sp. CA-252508 TaxID=3418946 RepID=UPI003D89E3EB